MAGILLSTSLNAGVSLQALMALLGHISAEMSLRYGRLFDTTVRAEYERALDRPNSKPARPPPGAPACPWPTLPAEQTGRTPR